MELKFDIEYAIMEADALRSMLISVTVAAYDGGYTFDTYEAAFNYVCMLACDHFKHLEEMTDEAFGLRDAEKVLHMQAESKKGAFKVEDRHKA